MTKWTPEQRLKFNRTVARKRREQASEQNGETPTLENTTALLSAEMDRVFSTLPIRRKIAALHAVRVL